MARIDTVCLIITCVCRQCRMASARRCICCTYSIQSTI